MVEGRRSTPMPTGSATFAQPAGPSGPNPEPRRPIPCREAGDSCPPQFGTRSGPLAASVLWRAVRSVRPASIAVSEQGRLLILPPRCPWYFVAEEGVRHHRSPTHNVDFAAIQTMLQGSSSATRTSSLRPETLLSFRRAFLVGRTLNECLQLEGAWMGVEAAENTASVFDSNPQCLWRHRKPVFSPFGNFRSTSGTGVAGLDFNKFATISYFSSLESGELNIRRLLPMPPNNSR